MNIGNKIKELRKKRGVTQEQLADSIGVSFQAVSKWENNIALPDITLAPVLASYFGVSMDVLFDYNLDKIQQDALEIARSTVKYRNEKDYEKGCEIIEEGLRKYPDNDILLNNLLYLIPYEEQPDRAIDVASKLIDVTSDDATKYDAFRFLAYAYKAKGDIKSAQTAIEQIPEIYFTKLSEIAYLLDGKPKWEAAEKQKWVSFEDLLQMMWKLAECYEADGHISQAIGETEKALKVIPILENSAFDVYVNFFNEQIERLKSKL